MKTRIIFAAVGIPVLLLILLAAPSWATLAMCAALAAVASYELMHAVGDEEWELLPAMPVLAAAMTGALGVRQLDIPVIWILAGIFAVVLGLTYSLSNLALLLLGRTYTGEMPPAVQLASMVVQLFLLVFLVSFRKYSLRRTPKGGTERPVPRHGARSQMGEGPAGPSPM